MTVLPNKHYSGHSKDTEEKGKKTRRKSLRVGTAWFRYSWI